jgi:serine/threonine protein kinase
VVGTKLSHFEITAKIGEGGMGEVYQATDTKLNRQVALKILPESFSKDAERMARFSREAQLLASLNHPNIAAIYGLEETNGTRALVMELVEGEDLAERIARGPISHSKEARSRLATGVCCIVSRNCKLDGKRSWHAY